MSSNSKSRMTTPAFIRLFLYVTTICNFSEGVHLSLDTLIKNII